MKSNLKIAVDIDALAKNIAKLPTDLKEAKLKTSEKEAVIEDIEDIILMLEDLKQEISLKK